MSGLLPLLQEFYAETLQAMLRHQAGAALVTQYDVNNAYQHILNRQHMHLSWIAAAIAELGGTPPEPAPTRRVPDQGPDAARTILAEDAAAAQAFVDRWRPRLESMTNARHRRMLELILGETLEQRRAFDQALAGRTDLLGRRGEGLGPSHGEVLPTRWIE